MFLQIMEATVGEESRVRGHVWGSPVGVDDEAAPPRTLRSAHRKRGNPAVNVINKH